MVRSVWRTLWSLNPPASAMRKLYESWDWKLISVNGVRFQMEVRLSRQPDGLQRPSEASDTLSVTKLTNQKQPGAYKQGGEKTKQKTPQWLFQTTGRWGHIRISRKSSANSTSEHALINNPKINGANHKPRPFPLHLTRSRFLGR